MKIIASHNAADYHAWFARALNDDGVWPYLSTSPRYHPYKPEDDDWERRIVMDDGGLGCCAMTFSRDGDHSVSMALWVLSVPMRAVVAAQLLRDAISVGARYDLKWIDSGHHASNEPSRNVHEKFFGKPWGIEPEGVWNGKLRRYEDGYKYRVAVDVIERRLAMSPQPVAEAG